MNSFLMCGSSSAYPSPIQSTGSRLAWEVHSRICSTCRNDSSKEASFVCIHIPLYASEDWCTLLDKADACAKMSTAMLTHPAPQAMYHIALLFNSKAT